MRGGDKISVFSFISDPSVTSTGQMCCFLLQIFASFGKERAPCPPPPSLPLLVPSAGDASWEAYLPPWRQTRGCASGQSRWSGGTSGTWHRSGICLPHRCHNKCPAGYSTWSWRGCPNLAGEREKNKCCLAVCWTQAQTVAAGSSSRSSPNSWGSRRETSFSLAI